MTTSQIEKELEHYFPDVLVNIISKYNGPTERDQEIYIEHEMTRIAKISPCCPSCDGMCSCGSEAEVEREELSVSEFELEQFREEFCNKQKKHFQKRVRKVIKI